jgi:hypothetical protein
MIEIDAYIGFRLNFFCIFQSCSSFLFLLFSVQKDALPLRSGDVTFLFFPPPGRFIHSPSLLRFSIPLLKKCNEAEPDLADGYRSADEGSIYMSNSGWVSWLSWSEGVPTCSCSEYERKMNSTSSKRASNRDVLTIVVRT